ncbi:CGP-CTERM sorting domain-containing protein [Thermococcus sp.]|uniref:metallophosphoesterase family protein n=1 Tax=Thermococcus sp. TaxID=35749 RepID=UPI0026354052|nr:CGP-CTERM sorting domain-containing protein [Thermococcus sp.]
MAKRLLAGMALLISVLALLGAVPVNATSSQYSTTYSKYLYQPAPAVPAFAIPGGNFTLHLKGDIQGIDSVIAVSVLHGPYRLHILESSFSKGGPNYAVIAVPDDIAPDDYFLLIKTDKGTLVLPNGLKVFKEWPKTLTIGWVSDTHVTSSAKIGYVCGPYFQHSIYKLEQMCSNPIPLHSVVATDSAYTYWAMQRPTLIINTGDDVDSSNDLVGYTIMYNIMEHAAAAGQAHLSIKGNHDNPPVIYSQLIGPPVFYVTIGKFLIIGLDTGGDRGWPTMDEIKWMEKVLNEHPGYTPIILYHHPFFFAPRWNYLGGKISGLDPSNDADWAQLEKYIGNYWRGNLTVARRFLEDVVKYNIPLTMSGHIHHDMYWVYTDKEGHTHYFLTLTSTGAPDKESNPPSNPKHSPTWYGTNLVVISQNGSVEMPLTPVKFNGNKVTSDFISIPVPQEFMIFRHNTDFGTVAKFINELNHTVTGPITFVIPEGAKIDPEHTNITYKVLGERTIGDRTYLMINASVPVGVSQIVIDKGPDTEKPVLQIAYLQPTHPAPDQQSMLYFTAQDNLGIRDLYAQIYDSNGKLVTYGKVDKFPAEPGSGKPTNTFYTVELPPLKPGKYKVEVVAVDFYGNKATVSQNLNIASPTSTTSTSSSSTSTTSSGGGGICGPALIVALAALPLLLRKRK